MFAMYLIYTRSMGCCSVKIVEAHSNMAYSLCTFFVQDRCASLHPIQLTTHLYITNDAILSKYCIIFVSLMCIYLLLVSMYLPSEAPVTFINSAFKARPPESPEVAAIQNLFCMKPHVSPCFAKKVHAQMHSRSSSSLLCCVALFHHHHHHHR